MPKVKTNPAVNPSPRPVAVIAIADKDVKRLEVLWAKAEAAKVKADEADGAYNAYLAELRADGVSESSIARALGVNRNTVRYRVARAETETSGTR